MANCGTFTMIDDELVHWSQEHHQWQRPNGALIPIPLAKEPKAYLYQSIHPIFGIRSPKGDRILAVDPFISGAEIPLAEGEELYCYLNQEALAQATQRRDEARHNKYPWAPGLLPLFILMALSTVVGIFIGQVM